MAESNVPQLVDKKEVVILLLLLDLKLTFDLADRYGKFVYDGLPDLRSYTKILKNSDDEVDERTSEEYLRDLDIEFH
ncbi:hypothetical protein Tco_1500980 [Tanacetum coccineum]